VVLGLLYVLLSLLGVFERDARVVVDFDQVCALIVHFFVYVLGDHVDVAHHLLHVVELILPVCDHLGHILRLALDFEFFYIELLLLHHEQATFLVVHQVCRRTHRLFVFDEV